MDVPILLVLPGNCIVNIGRLLRKDKYHDSIWSLRFVCKKLYKDLIPVTGLISDRETAIGIHGSVNMFLDVYLCCVYKTSFIKNVFLGALGSNNVNILNLFDLGFGKEIATVNDKAAGVLAPLVRVTYEKSNCFIHPELYLRALGKNGNQNTMTKVTNLLPSGYFRDLHYCFVEAAFFDDDPDKSMEIIEWLSKHDNNIGIQHCFHAIHRVAAVKTLERMIEPFVAYRDQYLSFFCLKDGPLHPSKEKKETFLSFLEQLWTENNTNVGVSNGYPITECVRLGNLACLERYINNEGITATKDLLTKIVKEEKITPRLRWSLRSDAQGGILFADNAVSYLIRTMEILGDQWTISPQELYRIVNIKVVPMKIAFKLIDYLVRRHGCTPKSLKLRNFFTTLSPVKVIQFLVLCEKHLLSLDNLGLKEGHVILALTKWGRGYLSPSWPFSVGRALSWLCNISRDRHQWDFFYVQLDVCQNT